mgnify:CR=1 FL=1|jgi:hypothetical protein
MAENRGGMRPTAPQNNPANVSATGGAGQSGQYTGFAYSENKKLNESRVAGNAAVNQVNATAPSTAAPQLPELTSITAESELPNQSVMFGSTPETRNMIGTPAQQDVAPDMESLRNFFPLMEVWANQPDTPQSTKEYVNYLRTLI